MKVVFVLVANQGCQKLLKETAELSKKAASPGIFYFKKNTIRDILF